MNALRFVGIVLFVIGMMVLMAGAAALDLLRGIREFIVELWQIRRRAPRQSGVP